MILWLIVPYDVPRCGDWRHVGVSSSSHDAFFQVMDSDSSNWCLEFIDGIDNATKTTIMIPAWHCTIQSYC